MKSRFPPPKMAGGSSSPSSFAPASAPPSASNSPHKANYGGSTPSSSNQKPVNSFNPPSAGAANGHNHLNQQNHHQSHQNHQNHQNHHHHLNQNQNQNHQGHGAQGRPRPSAQGNLNSSGNPLLNGNAQNSAGMNGSATSAFAKPRPAVNTAPEKKPAVVVAQRVNVKSPEPAQPTTVSFAKKEFVPPSLASLQHEHPDEIKKKYQGGVGSEPFKKPAESQPEPKFKPAESQPEHKFKPAKSFSELSKPVEVPVVKPPPSRSLSEPKMTPISPAQPASWQRSQPSSQPSSQPQPPKVESAPTSPFSPQQTRSPSKAFQASPVVEKPRALSSTKRPSTDFDTSFLDDACNDLDRIVNEASFSLPKKPEGMTPPMVPLPKVPTNPPKPPSAAFKPQVLSPSASAEELSKVLNDAESPAKARSSSKPTPPQATAKPTPIDARATINEDDIDRLLNELDIKVGRSPPSSTRAPSASPSTSSQSFKSPPVTPASASTPKPAPPPSNMKPGGSPAPADDFRFTLMLEDLRADLEQLGVDQTELPEEKPIKFKHLSENIDLAKLKKFSVNLQKQTDEAPGNKISAKLQYGNAHLILPVLPGAEGSVVLQQAIQKCGGVGTLEDFKLYLVTADQEKKLVSEKEVVYDSISKGDPATSKLLLEKILRNKPLAMVLAVSKGDYFIQSSAINVTEGDMFYVLDQTGPHWRVKPISRNGKDFDIPREYLQIDPEGWKKLQYKYGQKVYFDQGEPVAGPKASPLMQLKSFTSKFLKSLPNFNGTS